VGERREIGVFSRGRLQIMDGVELWSECDVLDGRGINVNRTTATAPPSNFLLLGFLRNLARVRS
jgi:hypothetical protein